MAIYKVYKVTNSLNGKICVGQTKQAIEKRFIQHLHADSPLGQAMRQCGAENFNIETIEKCETQEKANERERFWIKSLNCKVPNGYNILDGGGISTNVSKLKKTTPKENVVERKTFTMRLPVEDYDKLKILSKKNKRSMASELEFILEMYFEKYELQNGKVITEKDTAPPVSNNQVGNNNLFVNSNNKNVAAV